MKKVKIKYQINDKKYQIDGKISQNILYFTDKDVYNTKVEYDIKRNILTRKNKNHIIIDFNNKEITTIIEEHNLKIPITITSKTQSKNMINIIYKLEEDTFIFKLKYKEVK